MGSMERKFVMGYVHIPKQQFRRSFKAGFLDLLVVLVAYSIAFWGRAFTTAIDYVDGLPFIFFAAVVMLVSLYLFGVYQRIWEQTSGHGITVIVNAVGAATVLIVMIDMIFEPRPLPISVIAIGNAFALGGFVALRYRSRVLDGASWRWKAIWHQEFPGSITRVLIVGAGESGQALAWRLKHRTPKSKSTYQIVGFIDDDPAKQDMYIENCPVLGGRADIQELVEELNIDLIIVAIHNITGPDFRQILGLCESTKARIKVVPDVVALMSAKRNVALLRDVQPEDLIGRTTISRHEAVDMTPVTGKVILVTGAAGSIGSELSRQLVDYEPTKLILLDANESGLHDLCTELAGKSPDKELIAALIDITDKKNLEQVFATYQPQIVFHAAAYKHVPVLEQYPDQAVRVNIGGTRNLVELAQDYQVERFVLISTDKAVNPTSVMGASKRVCELLLDAYSQQDGNQTVFTSVRFGNVLGSRGSVVPTFNRQIESGGPVTITHPEMTRYFMSIPEAVNLVIHAACLTKGREIFLLKMGEVVRIIDLAERMIRLRGLRPYEDIEIKFTGIRPGEKLHEELHTSTENIVDTAHPNIIQLQHPNDNLHSYNFLDNVDQLLKDGIGEKHALNTLQKIIRDEGVLQSTI